MHLLSLSLLRVCLPIIFTKPASTADQYQSALPCMDPNSQPQLQINSDCPSSLTSLSTCLQSKSYKENCIAYCEQFLYWFLGPEVPFPNSNCQPDEPCTFAGAKSLAITNTYSFSAGIAGTGSDLFKIAFNLGSSYSYSTTTANTQTFTQTRPTNGTNGTTGCGYWTFLPYYVTSCGFYINSTKHSKNTWGTSFFGENSQSCGSSHDTLFGCTNTTYTDRNGEPEGDVVFVNTNCTSNERLEYDQDPRYGSLIALETNHHDMVSLSVHSPSYSQIPVPFGDETCFRACLCGYTLAAYHDTAPIPGSLSSPYQACDCGLILASYYLFRKSNMTENAIFLTSANMTLWLYYGGLPCDAQGGNSGVLTDLSIGTPPNVSHTRWMWVPDNGSVQVNRGPDRLPKNVSVADYLIKNDYECFDSFNNMQTVMVNYINQTYGAVFEQNYKGKCVL